MRIWAQHVTVNSNSGSNSSQSIASFLGYNLYSAMIHSFQQVLDCSLKSGELKFANEDETPLTPTKQKDSLDKLLLIKASDSATDGVRRLLYMSK